MPLVRFLRDAPSLQIAKGDIIYVDEIFSEGDDYLTYFSLHQNTVGENSFIGLLITSTTDPVLSEDKDEVVSITGKRSIEVFKLLDDPTLYHVWEEVSPLEALAHQVDDEYEH